MSLNTLQITAKNSKILNILFHLKYMHGQIDVKRILHGLVKF